MVATATAVLFTVSGRLAAINLVSIVYLVPVMLAALRWGIWPGLLAAIAGALAADFFFYPPLYSFWIGDTQHIADLLIFLIIALVIGKLAADLRERKRELNDLYGYSRQLAACFTTSDLIAATRDYLSKCLGRPTLLLERASLDKESTEAAGVSMLVRRKAQLALSHNGAAAHTIFDEATRHIWLARAVSLGDMQYVVFADLGTSVMDAKRRLNRRIDEVLAEAADNIARLDLAKAIEEFKAQAQADKLKSALVMTMSHELRTPLVSILGAASVLDQMAEIRKDARARSLVEAVHDEAARLDGNIKNLVDAAGITTEIARPSPELTDPVDMVRAAIEQKKTQLAGHKLKVSLAPDLPLVRVQSVLIENALGQLLDNAAKYSPPGSTVTVDGRADEKWVILSVTDRGVGLTSDERSQVGQRSFRAGRHAGIRGSGLGLWIANTFVTENGGKLDVESAGPGLGTTFRIRLPVAR